MICPDCKGTKQCSHAIGVGDASVTGWFKCSRCAGAGEVDPERDKLWSAGRDHRAWRIGRHESLRDCARRYGWTLAQLADMENGRVSCSDLPVLPTSPKIIGEGGHA